MHEPDARIGGDALAVIARRGTRAQRQSEPDQEPTANANGHGSDRSVLTAMKRSLRGYRDVVLAT
jgi:hypothetical protein